MHFSRLGLLAVIPALITMGCIGGGSASDDDDDGGEGLGGFGGGGGGGSADSDEDGYSNTDENSAGTNPDYAYSHPYAGGYNVGYCADGVAEGAGPTGTSSWSGGAVYQVGDIAENFGLTDQYGETVDLYSFCGRTTMLVFGAFW